MVEAILIGAVIVIAIIILIVIIVSAVKDVKRNKKIENPKDITRLNEVSTSKEETLTSKVSPEIKETLKQELKEEIKEEIQEEEESKEKPIKAVLAQGQSIQFGSNGKLPCGEYTLESNDGEETFNVRVGRYVKQYSNGDKLILTENHKVTAISTTIIIR